MLIAKLNWYGTGADPAPSFPTDTEIEIAEQLRQRLEERYLARPAESPSSPAGPDDHD